jgi:hypothetical protein
MFLKVCHEKKRSMQEEARARCVSLTRITHRPTSCEQKQRTPRRTRTDLVQPGVPDVVDASDVRRADDISGDLVVLASLHGVRAVQHAQDARRGAALGAAAAARQHPAMRKTHKNYFMYTHSHER